MKPAFLEMDMPANRSVAFLLTPLLLLAGCADKILSDESIRGSTALALNVPLSSVRISDRRYDGVTTTYYTATTPRHSYRCTIDGGTISSFGMTNPPVCSP